MIKRFLPFISAAILLAAILIAFTGCSRSTEPEQAYPEETQDRPLLITCASFAEYDWTKNILGENPGGIELKLLNESGVDMHSYQPSVEDMSFIDRADLLIFTGGDSEFWISEAAETFTSKNRTQVCFMDIFEEKGLAEGYSWEEGHDHNHSHHEDGFAHLHDEHLWLSLKMAPVFIEEIAEKISVLDSDNQDTYNTNASNLIASLRQLDARFEKKLGNAGQPLIFADRYPFKYLFEDYGIDYLAAFEGCSAETEADFETILSLSRSMDEVDTGIVMVLKNTDTALAQTIIDNSSTAAADAAILTLDSMQSVNAKDIAGGASYLSIMENNLAVLEKAME